MRCTDRDNTHDQVSNKQTNKQTNLLFVCLFVRRRNECHFSRSGRPREKISCFCGPCIAQETSKRIVLSSVQPVCLFVCSKLDRGYCPCMFVCLYVCLFVVNLIMGRAVPDRFSGRLKTVLGWRLAVCLFVCLLEEEMSVISLGQVDLEKK